MSFLDKIEQLKEQKRKDFVRKEYIDRKILENKQKITEYKTLANNLSEAQAIIEHTANKASANFKDVVVSLCSSGLSDIFDEEYKVTIEFSSRGKTNKSSEARILMEDSEGHVYNPMYSKGGGVRDCLSYILRVVLLSTACHKTNRQILILDEPLRDLSENLRSLGGNLLKTISKNLNIQVIISSNEHKIVEASDYSFNVEGV